MSHAKRIVICGGGVIGAAIAYFLSRRGAVPVVVERHEIAGAASGKSGGFLALDWCRGTPLDRLARRSFALHAELAADLGNPWGYRRLTTYGGYATADTGAGRAHDRPWLSESVLLTQQLGSPQTTALVEPRAFTRRLMQAAQAQGAVLRQGTVEGLARRPGGAIQGARLRGGEVVDGDAVVVAMGPWSGSAASWLPLPPVFGHKGHSLIFETGDAFPAEALFLEVQDTDGEILTPELFPRADGTTWVCAISSGAAMPGDPADVVADDGAYARLETMCRTISPVLTAERIKSRQACFRPVTADGLPLIGRVPGSHGAYVATGHSVWGILNAPATGEAMAELILHGELRHVDLAPFAPGRLVAMDPDRLART